LAEADSDKTRGAGCGLFPDVENEDEIFLKNIAADKPL